MNREHTIIELYLKIEVACTSILHGLGCSYRYYGGRKTNLTDAELLTIEVFGEMSGHHTDAAIWRYTNSHWRDWFPKLNSYTAFAKQSANLMSLKHLVMSALQPPHTQFISLTAFQFPFVIMRVLQNANLLKVRPVLDIAPQKMKNIMASKGIF